MTCPPDTETPGLVSESVGKPEETRLISEYGGLFSAKEVADQLVLDALNTGTMHGGRKEGSKPPNFWNIEKEVFNKRRSTHFQGLRTFKICVGCS